MLIQCYRSTAPAHTLDKLFNYATSVGGWASIGLYAFTMDVYIPEDRSAWAILIDPNLLRVKQLDYIL
jgi:hypothetical protein